MKKNKKKNKKIKKYKANLNFLYFFILLSLELGIMLGIESNDCVRTSIMQFIQLDESNIRMANENIFAAYLSQISLTFIVVSIITVLSDKTRNLYWVNLVEYKLVEPRGRGFRDFVNYSFIVLVFSTFGIVADYKILFYTSFIINIILLFFLTKSVLGIYFDVNRIKKELEKNYEKSGNSNIQEKKENLLMLKANTINALLTYDFNTIKCNFEFYAKYCSAEEISYYFEFANLTNIRMFKIILVEFKKRFKEEVEEINSKEIQGKFKEIENLLKKYNVIEHMDEKIIHELTRKDLALEFRYITEDILDFSYEIIIEYTCMLAGMNNYSEYTKKLEYKEFRAKIRKMIDELKPMDLGKQYSERMHTVEIDTFGRGIDDKLILLFEDDEKKYIREFQRNLKQTPMRKILEMLESAIDNGNNYFVTVFISVYQQFPIFKYMNQLDENYNNNTVFKDINNSIKKCIINNDSNDDWKGLFSDIMGT